MYQIEVPECDCEGVDEHETAPTVVITWPDGREDGLPANCFENPDVYDEFLESLEELASFGRWTDADMPVSAFSSRLLRVSPDVYVIREGDPDEEAESQYVRGELAEVVRQWFDRHEFVKEFALAEHHGLLGTMSTEDGPFPSSFFDPEWAAAACSHDFVELDVNVPNSLLITLAAEWKASGLTWPKEAATSDGAARDAWTTRISE